MPEVCAILVSAIEGRIDSKCSAPGELQDHPREKQGEMATNGVVRQNHVMSIEMASELRKWVMSEFKSVQENDSSTTTVTTEESSVFSRLLSSENRWDFRLPMSVPVEEALKSVLAPGTPLGDLMHELVLGEGKLFELGAFVSMTGAERQDVHSDTIWSEVPALYTCLIGLQDVSADMGPTLFVPGTQHMKPLYHTPDENSESDAKCEGFLNPYVIATLRTGDAAVYDSRTLHCGGANDSEKERVLFYFSFINSAGPLANKKDFWNVTSIRPEYVDKYTLNDFRQ